MFYNMSAKAAAEKLECDLSTGLSDTEAKSRLEKYGENRLAETPKKSLLKRFAMQFNDSMIIILLISAALSFGISLASGSVDFFDPAMILIIVILNAAMGIFWENKAEKSLEALSVMSAPESLVLRNGKKVRIPSEKLVPGDIIFLKQGDIVPADARIIKSSALHADESSLTGESVSVEKSDAVIIGEKASVSDIKNCVFSSSVITGGTAEAIVTHTGMNTKTGAVAGMLISENPPKTPLQTKLEEIGGVLSKGAVAICMLIFVIGIFRKIPVFEMFMTAVGLAVAAIPEGLPAIVTILLSIGVSKMAAKNAVVRHLPAVETLGGATVICSDKTGTLTQNKMKVVEYFGDREKIISACAQCSDGINPTETALLAEAENFSRAEIIKDIPFSSKRKLRTVIIKNGNGFKIITKGAPDVLLEKCSLTAAEKEKIICANREMSAKALRVIGAAEREVSEIPKNPEEHLKFIGLAGIADPPRKEVKAAVKQCKKAGIKVVMITGDHPDTAKAIASQIGITGKVMTGKELNEYDELFLRNHIKEYGIFARVAPEHKVKIVRLLQSKGETVAMTGDGINDSPALKCADIGCSMGISGSDVAKNASDIILTDDNFATIAEAVRQGRGIYANIKKTVHFLLSCNIGEIMTIFTAIAFGHKSPLAAVQLLWVNLVTDSLPAISLGMEKAEDDIMLKPPTDRRKSIFADGMGLNIVLEGLMIGALSLLAYSIGKNIFCSAAVAQTMTFCVLSLSQLIHAFNMRSEHSIFKIGFLTNRHMVISFLICASLQICVVSVPSLAAVFKSVPLNTYQWICTALLSFIPFVTLEIEKLFD